MRWRAKADIGLTAPPTKLNATHRLTNHDARPCFYPTAASLQILQDIARYLQYMQPLYIFPSHGGSIAILCVCIHVETPSCRPSESCRDQHSRFSSPCSLAYLVVDFWKSSFASILAADFSVRTVVKHLLKLLPCQVSTATGQCRQFCNVGGNKRHTWCTPTT